MEYNKDEKRENHDARKKKNKFWRIARSENRNDNDETRMILGNDIAELKIRSEKHFLCKKNM